MTPEFLDFLRTNVRRVPDSDCLEWAGTFSRVPMVTVPDGKRQMYPVRRLLAQASRKAPLRRSERCFMTCDTPACVYEGHIAVRKDASAFAIARASTKWPPRIAISLAVSRSWAGREVPAKLPMREARKVAAMRAQGVYFKDIAREYGVTTQCVQAAVVRWQSAGII